MTTKFILYEDHDDSLVNPLLNDMLKNPPIPKVSIVDLKNFVFISIPFLHTLAVVVMFLSIFYSLLHKESISSDFRLMSPILIVCLLIVIYTKQLRGELIELCRLMIVVIISVEILQSMLGKLISSVSDDTVYAASGFLLITKMASCGENGNSIISLNSGVASSIILATRFNDPEKVAIMLQSSMIIFSSFPLIQKYFKDRNQYAYKYVLTPIITFIAIIASINTPFLLPYLLLIILSTLIVPFSIYFGLSPNRRILSHHQSAPREIEQL